MGERVKDDIVVKAPADKVWAAINDLDAYTQWADGVKSVEVVDTDDEGRPAKAKFHVDAKVLEVKYTLVYSYGENVVSWELTEGDQLSQLDGSYTLEPQGDSTKVTYALELDATIPLPGFLKKRGAKQILDTGLKGLKKRAESL